MKKLLFYSFLTAFQWLLSLVEKKQPVQHLLSRSQLERVIPYRKHTNIFAKLFSVGILAIVLTSFNLFAQKSPLLGIDVSSYQGTTINWSQVKAAGYTYAFAKATEGVSITDNSFAINMVNGENAGVIMGAYHFAHPESNTAAAEASYFLSVAGSYIKSCGLPPVLDFETTGSLSSAALTIWVQDWMNAVKSATGITPILYSDGSIASSLGSSVNIYPLWMADPDGSSTNPPPSSDLGSWATWAFKQYSWTGTVSGINDAGNVDLDVFNGDITAFNKLIGCTDLVSPTTAINVNSNWQNQSFTANFTDADNSGGSGLEKSYYTVADYNGSQWHGNAQRGFITDDFISIDTSWKTPAASGTWTIKNGALFQSDSTVNNTNLYTALNQTLSNRYIYHFKAMLASSAYSTNQRRFGIHFFCDTAYLSNRGNSYFIFFRQESSQLEFYKSVNNVYTQTKVVTGITLNKGQWYDYKVIFDRITGTIDVYSDNTLIGSWTDPTPLTTAGNYFSLRTGNAKVYFDSLEVFRSRNSSVTVNVGAASTNDIRYQNPNTSKPAGLIKSICNDSVGNISTIVSQKINIDWTKPSTAINVTGNWQTQNFTTNFTDADNTSGSGLEKSYYTVADYNGSQWHGNPQRGFITDDFVSLDTSWKTPAASGTWAISNGALFQSDSTVNNTNIYTALKQSLSNRYIYHFKAMLASSAYSTNQRRFGVHFFCDTAYLSQRGNSYFVYFRQELGQLEFYKNVNNNSTQTKVVTGITINKGQWYDYKIIFDRITGKIDVYRDNILIGTWTDPTPLTTVGDYFSFRTGNAKVYFDSLEVFRSRYPSLTVNVGAASTNDIRYQNPNISMPSGLIKSICNDTAGNISSLVSQKINVDWSNPICTIVNDGLAADIDTTISLTSLSANWNASTDNNSGIAKYYYAIGTTAGATDIVNWTDNNLNTSVTKSGLPLVDGQKYFFSIKTQDGAGLTNICNSDGVYADLNVSIHEYSETYDIKAYPNPSSGNIYISLNLKEDENIQLSLFDKLGKELIILPKTRLLKGNFTTNINIKELNLASGIYTLRIIGKNRSSALQLIVLP